MKVNALVALVTICVLAAVQQTKAYDMEADMMELKADMKDLKAAVKILTQKNLEGEIYERKSEKFVRYLTCATDAPAVSLPLGDLPGGISDGLSGQSRCGLYCQDMDGCKGYNFRSTPTTDGNQCQLYTATPTNFAPSADCQYYKGTIDLCVDPCTANNPCKNGGACKWIDFHFECTCPSGVIGIDCGMKPCDPSPCRNSGVCSVTATSYSCACTGGYTGSDCGTYPYTGFTYNAASNMYYKSFTEQVNFATALTRCTAINAGAHLPMFTTSAQYTAFITYVANLPAAEQTSCTTGWWIGLRRQTQSCGTTPWVWDLGNGNTATPVANWGQNWYPGEPNCGGGTEYYAHLLQPQRQLNDRPGANPICYICQISAA